jgi:hypothetical protein
LALRDSLASAVPGFSAASSGGGLAKLASLPLFAKLAGAVATLTAAGTIGIVQLVARDRDPAAPSPAGSAVRSEKGRPSSTPVRFEPASFTAPARAQPAHRAAASMREDAKRGERETDLREHEGEAQDVQDEAREPDTQAGQNDLAQDDGSGSADDAHSGESDSDD